MPKFKKVQLWYSARFTVTNLAIWYFKLIFWLNSFIRCSLLKYKALNIPVLGENFSLKFGQVRCRMSIELAVTFFCYYIDVWNWLILLTDTNLLWLVNPYHVDRKFSSKCLVCYYFKDALKSFKICGNIVRLSNRYFWMRHRGVLSGSKLFAYGHMVTICRIRIHTNTIQLIKKDISV